MSLVTYRKQVGMGQKGQKELGAGCHFSEYNFIDHSDFWKCECFAHAKKIGKKGKGERGKGKGREKKNEKKKGKEEKERERGKKGKEKRGREERNK